MAVVFGFSAIPAGLTADLYGERGGLKDSPVYEPAYSWQGFYAGINGGYGFSDESAPSLDGTIDLRDIRGPLVELPSFEADYDLELEGGFFGGQIGYNFQRGNFVFGIEADIQASDVSDDGEGTFEFIGGATTSTSLDIDYFGTVRGRIGYAWDRTLVYATGGFAYGDASLRQAFITDDGDDLGSSKMSETLTGYVVGGGIEKAFTPNLSVKLEYQYIDLGEIDTETAFAPDQAPGVFTFGTEQDIDLHTVRVGINYRLGETYEPIK